MARAPQIALRPLSDVNWLTFGRLALTKSQSANQSGEFGPKRGVAPEDTTNAPAEGPG